jgi:hypothetical protein
MPLTAEPFSLFPNSCIRVAPSYIKVSEEGRKDRKSLNFHSQTASCRSLAQH